MNFRSAPAVAPAGYGWAEHVDALVAQYGSLTAVAWKLVSESTGPEDVASIERALRRLRARGQRDGGVWGRRVLRAFGLPAPIDARLRWMGLYHSPFGDLPVPLCLEQLRLWDRPPIATSPARTWIHLGLASVALRRRVPDEAEAQLQLAGAGALGLPSGHDAAHLEIALARAFARSRTGTVDEVASELTRAERLLGGATLGSVDRACFTARLCDQRAFQDNRAGDHDAAFARYAALPADDTCPFSSYRRDAGLAYGHLRLGRPAEAEALAVRACEHAGDGGHTRLRAMGLLLLARIRGPGPGDEARGRARAIADRLEDDELRHRAARSTHAQPPTRRDHARFLERADGS